MAQMTMIQALRSAMDVMLGRNPDVVVFGEDVGYFGGVFRCTEGLQTKYGKTRVFDTPISEGGIVGVAVGMGAYGLDLGTFSPFLYAFREREKILDLFEEVCGARLTYSYLTPGGATADLPRGWLQKLEAFLKQFEPLIQEYHALLTTNAIFIKRTAAIGVMNSSDANGTTAACMRRATTPFSVHRTGSAALRSSTSSSQS